ncbi:MAG: synthase, partial [Thermoleophilia bacterium]|nr:synthase [Thermoleophilia bacterium]
RSRKTVPQVTTLELDPPAAHEDSTPAETVPFEPEREQMRLALTLGLRDYVQKNGFAEVVVGVSGGIDSAATAALCADALGPERVHCVSMPSRFSSEGTRSDARRVAESLGARSKAASRGSPRRTCRPASGAWS